MSAAPNSQYPVALPALAPPGGTLEGLKWLALLLMTGDHVNRFLLNGTLPILFELGRIALPIFVFVLACNLARPGQLERGTYPRTVKRLALFGTLASVPFIALGDLLHAGWWPLNVLFSLLALSITLYLIERNDPTDRVAAGILFMVAGSLVEYGWLGLSLGVATWFYCKQPSLPAAIATLLACAALALSNGNHWALAAIPLILAATRFDLQLPRLRWVFYAYYPLHLGVIWLLRTMVGDVG
ncbi:TraX family protein [Marinobacterium rhizophilum]|uniref:Conjugal transfer protein TraX n=1 Tax=Marinobacterium rhizophilum TaxID=420402 RepID=A0ABY5HH24_9GAMM|nr:TraX family protein [Marinobacterium rhizophilum]UTW11668.1 conjugal transfer protein TraX [Marinobacterium rhizophilum]